MDISNIQKAILMYEAAGGTLPDTGGVDCDLDPGNSSACDDFATKLQPYLKTIPTAPDGDFYVYNHDSSVDDTTFSIETTLSNDNTYGYSTSGGGGWYENPASPPPEEEGITITEVAHVNDGGAAMDLRLTSDDICYVANDTDGIRSYYFDSSEETLTNQGHIDDGGNALGIHYSGAEWFLANGTDGLRAYTNYDLVNFVAAGNINSGGEAKQAVYYDDGFGAIRIYLANGTDGLRAYNYNDPTFTLAGHIDDGGTANGIYFFSDYVLLANGTDGLRAYSFNGTTFTPIDNVSDGGSANKIASVDEGTFFVANGTDGLRAYTFDGSTLTEAGHIDDGGDALGIYADYQYIYLANGTDGLRIYTYDYDLKTFENVGHANTGGTAYAVSAGPVRDSQQYIFVANGSDGLRVYKTPYTGGY